MQWKKYSKTNHTSLDVVPQMENPMNLSVSLFRGLESIYV